MNPRAPKRKPSRQCAMHLTAALRFWLEGLRRLRSYPAQLKRLNLTLSEGVGLPKQERQRRITWGHPPGS
jgi:hypothetical protein